MTEFDSVIPYLTGKGTEIKYEQHTSPASNSISSRVKQLADGSLFVVLVNCSNDKETVIKLKLPLTAGRVIPLTSHQSGKFIDGVFTEKLTAKAVRYYIIKKSN